jgi:chemotaxis signal transduction protein
MTAVHLSDTAEQSAEFAAVGDSTGLTILRCGDQEFGLDVHWVREIRPLPPTTPIPGFPPFWRGLTALRGEMYPVLDLRQFLWPDQSFDQPLRQVAFTAVNGQTLGLLVEEILAVRWVAAGIMVSDEAADLAPYTLGRTADQTILLDLPALYQLNLRSLRDLAGLKTEA